MSALDSAQLDRAKGALVGLAVGDAVGTTLEFTDPWPEARVTDMVGGGPFMLEPGQWTDDTSMALCLAESIISNRGHNPTDQLERYVDWWRNGTWSSTGACFDIGIATESALTRYIEDGSVTDLDVDQEQAGSGSIMRLAPVSIFWHGDIATASKMAGESSRTTHPARRPVDACRLLGGLIAGLIQGRPFDEIMEPNPKWATGLDDEVHAVWAGSRWQQADEGLIRGSGFVVDSLEAALWAVAGASDFREAVLRAANLGDDADTTAAVAGQIAGAIWGCSNIPESWSEQITHGEAIAEMAEALFRAS